MHLLFLLFFSAVCLISSGQKAPDSLHLFGDVRILFDHPPKITSGKTILILYALPNGNTTEWTMGKKRREDEDWHFDIQHIRAQTDFLRLRMKENIILAYLENSYRSWPAWKQKHADYRVLIRTLLDTLMTFMPRRTRLYLNGHSGGGSFIFGYLDAVPSIPSYVERISFLDSNYGYDSSHAPRLAAWLKRKKATLTVFAYNDSVALYNGKPVVSATGGTWYKSRLMMRQIDPDQWRLLRDDSLIIYETAGRHAAVFLKTNPERKIFHTQQVEYNGLIHSVLYRTKQENQGYRYFGVRAYQDLIRD